MDPTYLASIYHIYPTGNESGKKLKSLLVNSLELTKTNLLHVTTNNILDEKVSLFPKTKQGRERGLDFFFFFQVSLA